MPNISQIEINDTTYDLCDISSRNLTTEINNWFLYNDPHDSYGGHGSNSDHATVVLNNIGDVMLNTGYQDVSYSLCLWGDTGNIRYDKCTPSTDSKTILGYVPISKSYTVSEVKSVAATSVITNGTGWKVTGGTVSRWGQIVHITAYFETTASTSVTTSGNINNIVIGTLSSDYTPPTYVEMHSSGDEIGAAWGYITNTGAITIGAFEGLNATRTIASGAKLYISSCYVSTMPNNY